MVELVRRLHSRTIGERWRGRASRIGRNWCRIAGARSLGGWRLREGDKLTAGGLDNPFDSAVAVLSYECVNVVYKVG